MGDLTDLTDLICKRLEIVEENQKRCVRHILGDTIAFSDYRRDNLDEDRLDKLVNLVSGFINEIRDVTDNPNSYGQRLTKLREILKNSGV